MKRFLIYLFPIALGGLAGSLAISTESDIPKEPVSQLRELCDKGQYHQAVRELPSVMKAWDEYTKQTGRTAEGAAGYEYGRVMFGSALKGDADWGKILDDPEIPYAYKIQMIFEILEARLGKGAVYAGNKDNLIVPRHGRIDLKNMIKIPEENNNE